MISYLRDSPFDLILEIGELLVSFFLLFFHLLYVLYFYSLEEGDEFKGFFFLVLGLADFEGGYAFVEKLGELLVEGGHGELAED